MKWVEEQEMNEISLVLCIIDVNSSQHNHNKNESLFEFQLSYFSPLFLLCLLTCSSQDKPDAYLIMEKLNMMIFSTHIHKEDDDGENWVKIEFPS